MKTLKGREQFFLRLYKLSFPDVAAYIRKRGGTLEDARDIFQDCLVIYYEKAVAPDYSPVKNERAYLMGIAKNLWFGEFARQGRGTAFPEELSVEYVEKTRLSASQDIIGFLEQSGRKCMEMLKAFYYDRFNMQEMAANFGFGSVRSATVQKYKCLEKVRDKIKEKSLQYEDFVA